jgi:hypothetical protein
MFVLVVSLSHEVEWCIFLFTIQKHSRFINSFYTCSMCVMFRDRQLILVRFNESVVICE